MNSATVIFPDQLFRHHPGLARDRLVFLVEEQLFFRDYFYPARFHQKKLVLHRASLQAYRQFLAQQGYTVIYIPYQQDRQMNYLFQPLIKHQVGVIYICALVDDILTKRLQKWCAYHGIKIVELDTPKFLTPPDWWQQILPAEPPYSLTQFYIAQRKRLNVLVKDNKPVGGKWSFDPANRKKLPKQVVVPTVVWPEQNDYVLEAQAYVQKHFRDHWGSVEHFSYPITHTDAEKWLADFLQQRLANFGDYEDAMSVKYPILFHSVLTPMLNIGLLTPVQVLQATLDYAQDHVVPLNSLEGFIRQIIGWREFMAVMYLRMGTPQRHQNFWQHARSMPPCFYTGTTGILPVDHVIQKVLKTAYCHHIERLMVLGNFMLLCEIHPQAVYQWFMELFIDSYDWVMVPNVYGMSQYSDGGWMTTKPYLSGSNYIRKMSDFPAGDWCEIWDGLYWRFIDKHQDFFRRNPRLSTMTAMLGKMDPRRRQTLWQRAEAFLSSLH
ncbi:MAG: cryptochrome/photolyase family protein [Gloeomargarita sp. SKYG116]|nr:cryptochrome/photolyase family protein [Gloeomargarita sp. SKYG116]MDW8402182.1 cryptochrome/photolyase family protein [Gloeomargarita sp. SKYGB_i_bin116]